MKMLNRTGCSIDPWDTLLDTCLQVEFVPLISIPWDWLFRHVSVVDTVCSPTLQQAFFPVVFFYLSSPEYQLIQYLKLDFTLNLLLE